MSTTSDTPPKEDEVHHMEYVKTKDTAIFKGVSADKQQLYLSYTAKDDEWKAYNTKKLLRKVDIRLLPCLVLMYMLNFLDRSNLAQARLGTLEKDLGMKGTDFNLATSILFVVSDTKHSFRERPTDNNSGLLDHATTLKLNTNPSKTISLPRLCNGTLGCHLSFTSSHSLVRRPPGLPNASWSCRSAFLSWGNHVDEFMVYPERARSPDRLVLLR